MIRVPGTLRSLAELEFLAEVHPCPACGGRAAAALRPRGGIVGTRRRTLAVAIDCAVCATTRTLLVKAASDLSAARLARFHLGGAAPSTTITPAELGAAGERAADRLIDAVEALAPAEWRANGARLDRAITCLVELAKFPPEQERPDAAARLADLLALDARRRADAPRIWAIEAAGRAPGREVTGAVTAETLAAHRTWLQAGRTGAGRLVVGGLDLDGAHLRAESMDGARLEAVTFRRADLAYASMAGTDVTGGDFEAANLGRAGFESANLRECSFDRAALGLARFGGATVAVSSFDGALLDRSDWTGARVTRTTFRGATFGNAVLDRARFEACDFRGADFSPTTPLPPATMRGAIFVACCLDGAEWAGREVGEAEFEACDVSPGDAAEPEPDAAGSVNPPG